ncbi:hypothetical protein H6F67_16765 [Microcoleus sp. FACHB-1515]|uniref:hypothetical protein n=1 Tax=Cyanophyceae TaxID=3028117 RepID=UPI001686F143|nr:hypothetical protein [Microcoleus sp. FACHB-1515]MBD2091498.1 hypothetical protein [Microcoleus sp. FACHB-1515]
MKLLTWISIFSVAALSIASSAAFAQTIAASDAPVVESAGLTADLNVPWSRPVQVVDPFEGEFLAVFDRNDISQRFRDGGGPSRFVSLWSRNSIRVLLLSEQGCDHTFFSPYFSGAVCDRVEVPRVVRTLFVRVGDSVLEIPGENSRFAVNEAVAAALRNAPEQNIAIRLVLEGGETIDSEIGKGTVAAWRSIY